MTMTLLRCSGVRTGSYPRTNSRRRAAAKRGGVSALAGPKAKPGPSSICGPLLAKARPADSEPRCGITEGSHPLNAPRWWRTIRVVALTPATFLAV